MSELTGRLSTPLADHYKIRRHLGEGGMATVYLAEDLKHKCKAGVGLAPLVVTLLCIVGCATNTSRVELSTEAWPEADELFRSDPRWLGGDDAYSVDLGDERVLWLFADSWIATTATNVRDEAEMVRNSIAIQKGYDPSSASIRFYWQTVDEEPRSFFPESNGVWYWPGDGIRLENSLLIFLMKIRSSDRGLGFEVFGSTVVLVDNPDEEPDMWNVLQLSPLENDFGVIVGSASVLRMDAYVYAFGSDERSRAHDVYLVRWEADRAKVGDLSITEWWAGEAEGWVDQELLHRKPVPVFSDGQTEFTVHYEPRLDRFLEVQTKGFGPAVLAMRSASGLTGPWSEIQTVYRPPEVTRPNAFIYAGKAHPELIGADLVMTYVVNSFQFEELLAT